MTEPETTDAEFEDLEDRIRMYFELYQINQDKYKKETGREYVWLK